MVHLENFVRRFSVYFYTVQLYGENFAWGIVGRLSVWFFFFWCFILEVFIDSILVSTPAFFDCTTAALKMKPLKKKKLGLVLLSDWLNHWGSRSPDMARSAPLVCHGSLVCCFSFFHSCIKKPAVSVSVRRSFCLESWISSFPCLPSASRPLTSTMTSSFTCKGWRRSACHLRSSWTQNCRQSLVCLARRELLNFTWFPERASDFKQRKTCFASGVKTDPKTHERLKRTHFNQTEQDRMQSFTKLCI